MQLLPPPLFIKWFFSGLFICFLYYLYYIAPKPILVFYPWLQHKDIWWNAPVLWLGCLWQACFLVEWECSGRWWLHSIVNVLWLSVPFKVIKIVRSSLCILHCNKRRELTFQAQVRDVVYFTGVFITPVLQWRELRLPEVMSLTLNLVHEVPAHVLTGLCSCFQHKNVHSSFLFLNFFLNLSSQKLCKHFMASHNIAKLFSKLVSQFTISTGKKKAPSPTFKSN